MEAASGWALHSASRTVAGAWLRPSCPPPSPLLCGVRPTSQAGCLSCTPMALSLHACMCSSSVMAPALRGAEWSIETMCKKGDCFPLISIKTLLLDAQTFSVGFQEGRGGFQDGPFSKKVVEKDLGYLEPPRRNKAGGPCLSWEKAILPWALHAEGLVLMTLLSGPPPASINPAFSLLPTAPCCPQGLPYGNLCARS